jgi:hypothetical protein
MSTNPTIRAMGMVAYLVDFPDGTMQLVLDEVRIDRDGKTWSRASNFRTMPMSREEATFGLPVAEDKMTDLGFAVVSRLASLNRP